MSKIVPTVGRMVHYYPSSSDWMNVKDDQPCAAVIVRVIDDEEVNLTVFDQEGKSHPRCGVPLKHEEGNKRALPLNCSYAAWMPYQKAVAKGEIPPTLHAEPKPDER